MGIGVQELGPVVPKDADSFASSLLWFLFGSLSHELLAAKNALSLNQKPEPSGNC